ncbi:MAG: N-acetyltransferase [Desulfococcaceae bacterium]|jgi:amino-acid N-acetyltransferase|nr:N-acetyltransferase [Desulfococcaceae bacterium]
MNQKLIIRRAVISDIRHIHALLHKYSHQGDLIPRPLTDLYDHIRDFTVAADTETGHLLGCCALQFCWEDLAEIRSLVVDEEFRRAGLASRLLQTFLEEALRYDLRQLFCLTFKADFFGKFGFTRIDRSELPLKIWADCMLCVRFPDCEGIAMMKELLRE